MKAKINERNSQASVRRGRMEDLSSKNDKEFEKQNNENNINKNEWDNTSNIDKQSVPMETRIAKHIAGEILKNNKILNKIHSNASVRRMVDVKEIKKN